METRNSGVLSAYWWNPDVIVGLCSRPGPKHSSVCAGHRALRVVELDFLHTRQSSIMAFHPIVDGGKLCAMVIPHLVDGVELLVMVFLLLVDVI